MATRSKFRPLCWTILAGLALACETGPHSRPTEPPPPGDGSAATDATTAEAGPPGDASPSSTLLGAPCAGDDDCDSLRCVGGRCTMPCESAVDCPASPEWTCAFVAGHATVCACSGTGAETCDGRDNDCNGKVDDGAPCAAPAVCSAGQCRCPAESTCSGACMDLQTDVGHCGACDVACPVGAACARGECRCPTGRTLCDGACVDEMTDAAHCGDCATACGPLERCNGGSCECAHTLCGGACVSLDDDPASCGHCGHDCTGGICLEGMCQPVELAPGQLATRLAIDESHVYWTTLGTQADSGDVLREAIGGGPVETVATDVFPVGLYAFGVAVNSTDAFWIVGSQVGSARKDGSTAPVVAADEGGTAEVKAIAVTDRYLFWITYRIDSFYEVKRANPDGTGAVTLATGPFEGLWATRVLVMGTDLYWVEQPELQGAEALVRSDLDGANSTRVLEQSVYGLAIDSTGFYFTSSGRIVHVDPGASGSETLAFGIANWISLDSESIYWAGQATPALGKYPLNGIFRAPREGGDPELLVGYNTPNDIVANATHLFYIAVPGNALMRLAK